MKPIIEIEELSKKFLIQHQSQPYLSLRDGLSHIFSVAKSKEEFWALRNVSQQIYPGESIGIIGRNGAGKSTLLKILSKITPPTKGRITIRGRVASLLEVGTGFHPELTGRENVFLNGSILGMRRREIVDKFDEIVDFAGTERFLDTPLKHYSSGMQLRLAFAVAAFLEQEVLIIDEVLAVGDSVFQQKCIQKMLEVSRSGRTVLFVSHNFSSLRALCKKGIVLNAGEKIFEGDIHDAINVYDSNFKMRGQVVDLTGVKRGKYAGEIVFKELRFLHWPLKFGESIKISVILQRPDQSKRFKDLDFGVNIMDKNNNSLIHMSNRFLNTYMDHDDDNFKYIFETQNILRPGKYSITLFLRAADVIQDYLIETIEMEIPDFNPYGYSDSSAIFGSIFPSFSIQKVQL
jgi:lipopolysaccharide transport system ATP-binding protein